MKHFIGIDGGGTKTEMLVISINGERLLSLKEGPCNPKSVSESESVLLLTGLLDECYKGSIVEPGDCLGICLGLAGISDASEKETVNRHMSRYFESRGIRPPFIYTTNDAEIALTAALGRNRGIIAIAGTGSLVYGISETGQQYRAGGWGHLLGDKGSGYEIGLQTLQSVMASYDGVQPPTQLTDLVLDRLGFRSPLELRSWIYQPSIQKRHIADFAELCIRAADDGDQAAISIIKQSAAELAQLTAALRRAHEAFQYAPVAVAGSIFKHSKLYAGVYREQLELTSGSATIVAADRRPVYGAAMLSASGYEQHPNLSGGSSNEYES